MTQSGHSLNIFQYYCNYNSKDYLHQSNTTIRYLDLRNINVFFTETYFTFNIYLTYFTRSQPAQKLFPKPDLGRVCSISTQKMFMLNYFLATRQTDFLFLVLLFNCYMQKTRPSGIFSWHPRSCIQT